MKNLIFTTLFTLITNLIFSQDNIWVRIPNFQSKRELVSQTLSQFNNIDIKQALPSSRNSELVDVYEISCQCDINELLYVTSKNSLFVSPEIGPNYQTLDSPNDYSIWGYDWALNSVNATQAWDFTHGDTSIVVAITDANYHLYHEELAGKVNFVGTNYSTDYSHGTAVAITAAGNTNNGCGKSSIGYNTRLQLRAMNYNQLLEATYSGAKVINASWASGCYYSTYQQAVIDEVYNNGTTIVAAAGNGSTCGGASNLVYPASYNHVISVSSIGISDNHQRIIGDVNSTHQHNSLVDLVAPGYDVLLSTSPGQYLSGNGTSFASPYVTGTVALMLSVNKCLTPDDIEWILKNSADSTIYNYNTTYIGQLGAGKLNSSRAVEMAKRFSTFSAEIKSKIICEIDSNQISVENIDGQYPFTYYWSNGQSSENIKVDSSQIYWVEVRDSRGCRFFSESYFEMYNKIQIQSDLQHVTCNGMDNGQISTEVSGGKGLIQYNWSTYETTPIITNLVAKDYNLEVHDEAGCTKIESYTITEPEELTTSINYTNPNEVELGSVELITNGGVAPYTFMWNTGQTSEDLYNIGSGFYEVLVTDANGCMSSENVVLSQTVVDVTGLDENDSQIVSIYPNPSRGSLNIIGVDVVDLFDLSGKLINHYSGDGQISIDGLSSGIYLVKSNKFTEKLIVE